MFAKLLKYEWKATAGTLGVFSLAAVGAGVVAAILLRIILVWEDQVPPMLMGPMTILLIGAFLAIYAYVIGSQILLLIRFYKNKFSDEGYLTFTLPVTSHQILLSSLANYVIWTVIVLCVTAATMLMVISVGTSTTGLFNREAFREMLWMAKELWYVEGAYGYILMGILYVISAGCYSVMMIHTAIVLGATFAKKHKVLASFGFGYAIHMAVSILSTGCMIAFLIFGTHNLFFDNDLNMAQSMSSMILPQVLLYAGVSIAGYFICNGLIKKKLNLP